VVQSQFLGKAITGLGGGCGKLYVIEGKLEFSKVLEGEAYQGILNPLHPFDQEVNNDQFYSVGEGGGEDSNANIVVTNSVNGIKGGGYQPFDQQQQNFY